jgi:hypothetical protein
MHPLSMTLHGISQALFSTPSLIGEASIPNWTIPGRLYQNSGILVANSCTMLSSLSTTLLSLLLPPIGRLTMG